MSAAKMVADSTQGDLDEPKKKRKKRKETVKKRSKKMKKEKESKRNKRGQKEDDDSDLDLDKDLNSIGDYMRERHEMNEQIFHCLRGPTLQRYIPNELKELSLEELKRRCLEHLEIMSKKRIRRLLAGDEASCISSSGTEEETSGDEMEQEEVLQVEENQLREAEDDNSLQRGNTAGVDENDKQDNDEDYSGRDSEDEDETMEDNRSSSSQSGSEEGEIGEHEKDEDGDTEDSGQSEDEANDSDGEIISDEETNVVAHGSKTDEDHNDSSSKRHADNSQGQSRQVDDIVKMKSSVKRREIMADQRDQLSFTNEKENPKQKNGELSTCETREPVYDQEVAVCSADNKLQESDGKMVKNDNLAKRDAEVQDLPDCLDNSTDNKAEVETVSGEHCIKDLNDDIISLEGDNSLVTVKDEKGKADGNSDLSKKISEITSTELEDTAITKQDSGLFKCKEEKVKHVSTKTKVEKKRRSSDNSGNSNHSQQSSDTRKVEISGSRETTQTVSRSVTISDTSLSSRQTIAEMSSSQPVGPKLSVQERLGKKVKVPTSSSSQTEVSVVNSNKSSELRQSTEVSVSSLSSLSKVTTASASILTKTTVSKTSDKKSESSSSKSSSLTTKSVINSSSKVTDESETSEKDPSIEGETLAPVLTQNQMELLELEMRARAIKSMLAAHETKGKK